MGAFGEKLRKQREQQAISLDAVSDTTKISIRMLRALEEEHFDQLPGGVFNKGFVRAYARQVGLNEEEAVADYLAAVRQNQLQAHSLPQDLSNLPGNDVDGNDLHGHDLHGNDIPGNNARNTRSQPLPADDRRKQPRRRVDRRKPDHHQEDHYKEGHRQEAHKKQDRRPADISPLPDSPSPSLAAQLPWGKLAVALLLITFALALWNSRRHHQPVAAAQPAPSSPQSPAPAQSVSAPTLTPAKTSPAKTLSSGKLSPGTITTASTTSRATNTTITLPTSPLSQPALKAALTAPAQPDSTTGSAPAPTNAPHAPAKPPTSFSLLIRAEENTWVSITADGKPVAQETLIAPAHTSVRATGEVVVKAGNAAGISFQLNGAEIPAQGNEGEVRTYVFDAAGFRVLAQPQSPAANR